MIPHCQERHALQVITSLAFAWSRSVEPPQFECRRQPIEQHQMQEASPGILFPRFL